MPLVGVIFQLQKAQTLPGETIRVAGARPELGAWDPRGVAGLENAGAEDVLRLKTGALRYPSWSMSAPVWLELEQDELKEVADGLDSDNLSTADSLDSTDGSLPSTPQSASPQREQRDSALGGTDRISLEYKFLKDVRQLAGDGLEGFQWESKIGNRHVSVPLEPGSMWLISAASWDSDEPARVSRIVQAEVDSLCMELDPEYMLGRDEGYAICTSRTCISSPGILSARRAERPSFGMEDKVEPMSARALPADKCEAGKATDDLESEVLSLQRESASLRAGKERAEERSRTLEEELAQLKEAMASMAERVEESAQRRAQNAKLLSELQGLQSELASARGASRAQEELCEEHARLRVQNAQLISELEGLQSELASARGASQAQEELGKENAQLRAQNAQLLSELEGLRSELASARGASQAQEEHSLADAPVQVQSRGTGPEGGSHSSQCLAAQVQSCPEVILEDAPVQAQSSGTGPEGGSHISQCLVARTQSCPDPRLPPVATPFGGLRGRSYSANAADVPASFSHMPSWCRTFSNTELPHEASPDQEEKQLNELLLKTRSSLSAAPLLEKEVIQEEEEAQSELMKALRRRREKLMG